MDGVSPDVIRLATTVSLAVRIEPGLLRRARLKLTPGVPVAVEQQLWFSPLVSAYTPRAIVLERSAARELRSWLAEDRDLLARSHALVSWAHREAPPTIQLEEEIVWRALSGAGESDLNALLAPALSTMTGDADRERGLARWAVRAVPSLPQTAQDSLAARLLAAGAGARLGLPIAAGSLEPGELAWVLPASTRRLAIGLELLRGGLKISEPPVTGAHVITVPAADPIELRVGRAGGERKLITVELGTARRHGIPRTITGAPRAVDVITADGQAVQIEPTSRRRRRARLPFAGPTELDFPNIQGFVVRGYRLPAAGYVFLRIEDPPRARALLADVIPQVITAERWDVKPDSGINVALSYEGLRALGLPEATLAAFPPEFRAGMASRARLLGDVGDSAPEHWEDCFRTREAHVLVMISAKDRSALEARRGRLRAAVEEPGGVTIVAEQIGGALPTGREHFGYADSFSQPAIEGSRFPDHPGAGAPARKGHWRPIRAGEFILGYPDEQNALPAAPPPDELSRNGSYLVYRKLRQDVAGFRRQLREAAALYPGGEELLAAKLVGRWRDGTPLDASPSREDAALVADKSRNNAFDFGDDPEGLRCPVGSHIRRMNPRLSTPFKGKHVNRHRIIRRGITYGEMLPDGVMEDDGEDRGVIFMTVQASLARQFEFVQAQWANTGNPFRLGDDQDPLIGPQDTEGTAKMTIPGRPPFVMGPLSRIVTTRGGEYYFAPGINGLRYLGHLGNAVNTPR